MAKRKAKKIGGIKISACYMVRDAAQDLKRSLESVTGCVDEIIVVDTGSVDSTVKVAESFGAKIFHVPWQDDFSTPRNVALKAAKGDWIVFLDADEFFVNDTAKNLRRAAKLARDKNFDGLFVAWINVDADNDFKIISPDRALRVFRNAPDLHYVGKIHETIYRGNEILTNVAMLPAEMLTLWHTGYSRTIVKSKLERNLKLLREELETSDKPERTYSYLADCYYGLEDFANAEKFARLHVEKIGQSLSTRPLKILLDVLKKNPARFDEYVDCLRDAVKLYPHVPEFSAQLAETFAERGDYKSAVDEMNHALTKAANYGEQYEASDFNAAKQNRARELIDDWSEKIPLTPDERRQKISQLTDELIRTRELSADREKILRLAKKIFALEPETPEPLEKIASLYIDYKMTDEADEVVTLLEKKFPPAAYRLMLRARIFQLQNNRRDCIKISERALSMSDDLLTTMIIRNLLGQAYRAIGDVQKSIDNYSVNAKVDISPLKDTPQYIQAEKIRREEYSNLLFGLHNVDVTREELFNAAIGFGKLLAHIPRFKHDRKRHARHKKIRVGYISPDIRFHVVAFFSAHFFTGYDKTRFEVFIYCNNAADNITEQFKANVDAFRDIDDKNARDVANQIIADEIDILVDLAGHTANNSLDVMAYKPAPIQISGIGYFDTTGLDTIDYFIADKFTDPEGLNEKFFTEKILRLQHSHFCYVWHDVSNPVTPAPCSRNGYITFASFNNFAKVTDEILTLWKKILDAVPNSRLYLKCAVFEDDCGGNLARERLQSVGIDLSRVDCEPSEVDYVRCYERVDIALDTFPYPGGGTTCDALYMGVPVITLVGERHNSRFGYSLLMNMGLGELCAFTADEYVQKAVDLAGDEEKLRDLHLTLRRRMEESPIMDDTIYMGEMEQAYEKIFNAWIADESLPNFPQDLPTMTVDEAREYYRRAMAYLPLETKNGKSKFKRVDFKRTIYFAELAAQVDSVRDVKLLVTIADRRFNTDDNIGAYENMRAAIDLLYSSGEVENFPADVVAEFHGKLAKYAQNNCRHVEAIENYDKASQIAEKFFKQLEFYDSTLLSLHFLDLSSEELAAPHLQYQKFFADVKPFTTYHKPHDRIRIAYICGDFRKHAIFSVVFGFVSCHDRTKFEVTCYSRNRENDEFTEFYRRGVEHFVDVRDLTAEELAKKIHDDEIDIAVDLAGHTGYNALPALAYKPAPVQISGIGYMSTTGSDAIDYFITDEILDPIGEHEKFFSEKFLYMPAQFSYARREDLPASNGAPCMRNGYVTFGTICRYMKINDDMLTIWAEILRRVPNAKLLMRAQEFISNQTVDELYAKMKSLGCDMERVMIRPAVHDYFGAIGAVDVILDSYPYVGGATTLDALYMGVPVVNFYGERHSTRFGKSILHSIGLDELSVNNVEAYIQTAAALANDRETLDALHKNLRAMFLQSDALNPMKYCRLLESKLTDILRKNI